MRKAIFIFIAIILMAASIDWIRSCSGLKSHKEVFGRELTYAEMYEYKDKDYDYIVRVPSFFTVQPDSLQEEKGRMRFDGQWPVIKGRDGLIGTGASSDRLQARQRLLHPLRSAM